MRCEAKARSGKRCQAGALTGGRRCSLHAHPGRAAAMGQLETPKSAVDIRALLGQCVSELRAGRLTPTLAYAIASVSTAFLRALDAGDVEERILQLEKFREEMKQHGKPN